MLLQQGHALTGLTVKVGGHREVGPAGWRAAVAITFGQGPLGVWTKYGRGSRKRAQRVAESSRGRQGSLGLFSVPCCDSKTGVRGSCGLHIAPLNSSAHLPWRPKCPLPPTAQFLSPFPQRHSRCHQSQRKWRGMGWGGPWEGPRGEKMLPHFSTLPGRQSEPPGWSPSQPSGPRALCSSLHRVFRARGLLSASQKAIAATFVLLLTLGGCSCGSVERCLSPQPPPSTVLLFCHLQPSLCHRSHPVAQTTSRNAL